MKWELIGTGLGLIGIGLALMLALPPPGWPKMPSQLVQAGIYAGLVISVAGIALTVVGVIPAFHARPGPSMFIVAGAAFLVVGFGWYVLGRQPTADSVSAQASVSAPPAIIMPAAPLNTDSAEPQAKALQSVDAFIDDVVAEAPSDAGRRVIVRVRNKGPGDVYSGAVQSRIRSNDGEFSEEELAEHERFVVDKARQKITRDQQLPPGSDPVNYVITNTPIPESIWSAIAAGQQKLYVFAAYPYVDQNTRSRVVNISVKAGFFGANHRGGVEFTVLKNYRRGFPIRPASTKKPPLRSDIGLGTPP